MQHSLAPLLALSVVLGGCASGAAATAPHARSTWAVAAARPVHAGHRAGDALARRLRERLRSDAPVEPEARARAASSRTAACPVGPSELACESKRELAPRRRSEADHALSFAAPAPNARPGWRITSARGIVLYRSAAGRGPAVRPPGDGSFAFADPLH